jgi:hypothetical protein
VYDEKYIALVRDLLTEETVPAGDVAPGVAY